MFRNRYEAYLAKVLDEYQMPWEAISLTGTLQDWLPDEQWQGWFRLTETGDRILSSGPEYGGGNEALEDRLDKGLLHEGEKKRVILVEPSGAFSIHPRGDGRAGNWLVGCPRCGKFSFSHSLALGCGFCGSQVVGQASGHFPWWGYPETLRPTVEQTPPPLHWSDLVPQSASDTPVRRIRIDTKPRGVLFSDSEADSVFAQTATEWEALRGRLSGPPREQMWPARERLAGFLDGYPNFSEVSDFLWTQYNLASYRHRREMAWQPLLLVGPPGCGKSSFAERLAALLANDEYQRIDMGHGTASITLVGVDGAFRLSKPGRILGALMGRGKGPIRNPIVILDEIDKITPDHQWDPLPALLGLLEPRDAAHFIDEFFGVAVDASGILYIGLANDTERLSRPLLSRFQVFEIPEYTQEQFVAKVVPQIYREWTQRFHPGTFPETLSEAVCQAVAKDAGWLARNVTGVFDRRAGAGIGELRPRPTFEGLEPATIARPPSAEEPGQEPYFGGP